MPFFEGMTSSGVGRIALEGKIRTRFAYSPPSSDTKVEPLLREKTTPYRANENPKSDNSHVLRREPKLAYLGASKISAFYSTMLHLGTMAAKNGRF
jgi:hypothetical protein